MIKVLVLSDLHCGSIAGLTPPKWILSKKAYNSMDFLKVAFGPKIATDYSRIIRTAWSWFERNIAEEGPFDVVVVNGDALDGIGTPKRRKKDIVYPDQIEQVRMAEYILNMIKCDEKYLVEGTQFHTGQDVRWEQDLADRIHAKAFGSRLYLNIGGLRFDFRHFRGNSHSPYTIGTNLMRSATWNALWAVDKGYDNPHVIVRSHIHRFFSYTDEISTGITTPALQLPFTHFGAQKCDNVVDFGFLVLKISDGDLSIRRCLYAPKELKPFYIKVL